MVGCCRFARTANPTGEIELESDSAELTGALVAEALALLSAPVAGADVYPSANAKGQAMTSIHDYVSEYEYRGDQDYKPNEHEQAMLEDAINGYIAETKVASPSAMRERALKAAACVKIGNPDTTTGHENTYSLDQIIEFANRRVDAALRALSPDAGVGMPSTDTPS